MRAGERCSLGGGDDLSRRLRVGAGDDGLHGQIAGSRAPRVRVLISHLTGVLKRGMQREGAKSWGGVLLWCRRAS